MDTLCRFDFREAAQRAAALEFRKSEVPFVATHVQNVEEVQQLWTWDYLAKAMGGSDGKHGGGKRRVEVSLSHGENKGNHFMYWKNAGARFTRKHPEWQAPTTFSQRTLPEWLAFARGQAERFPQHAAASEHWYLMTASQEDPWIERDLKIFRRFKKSWFVVNPDQYRGIHCRFGMHGIVAEAHFDGGRNFIAMLKGHKRYVLMRPEECKNIYLLKKGHPSGRHSLVDWAHVDEAKWPKFYESRAMETVVAEGEVLYVPSFWIHYPISLDLSVQCNCRSGNIQRHLEELKTCGFYKDRVGPKFTWTRGERR
eukprot:g5904.t1